MDKKTLTLSRPLIERSSIIERVVSKVTKGYSFGILGPNYIGKTTFLKNLNCNFETSLDNSVGVFINLKEAYRSDENLFSKIEKMIIESLPEISKSEKKIFHATSSESFLVFLNELTSRTNFESLFLLFDHVEILPEFYAKSLVDTVAKLTSKKKKDKLRFILVGSSMLLKIVNEQKDNVKRLETERLLDFTLEESHELVKRYFDMFKIDVRPEALDLLYKKTLGHPNLLQRLCDIIVNILLQQLNDQEALVLFKNYLKSLDIAINNKVINKLINRLGTFENLLQKLCNIIEKNFLESITAG